MSKKAAIIVLIISLIMVSAFSFLLVNLHTSVFLQPLSSANTTEFSATVTELIVSVSENECNGTICTEEYGSKLNLSQISKIIDSDALLKLHSGQVVFFKVRDFLAEEFDKMNLIYIYSLRTSEEEIASISDSSKLMEQSISKMESRGILSITFFQ